MDAERLIYMVNQIARNLAAQGEEDAALQTAQHIEDYWNSRMRTALLAATPAHLDPIAIKAVEILAHRSS